MPCTAPLIQCEDNLHMAVFRHHRCAVFFIIDISDIHSHFFFLKNSRLTTTMMIHAAITAG